MLPVLGLTEGSPMAGVQPCGHSGYRSPGNQGKTEKNGQLLVTAKRTGSQKLLKTLLGFIGELVKLWATGGIVILGVRVRKTH